VKRALAALTIASLAACSFEPLRAPRVEVPERYTAAPTLTGTASANVPGGDEQRFVAGKDIPADWWTLFRSPALDRLVRDALADSPSIAKVAARLRQAEEDLGARSGATRWPKVDGRFSANRVDADADALGTPALSSALPLNLLLASVSVSYTFDFFGATRNELDALRAEIDFERYQLEGARLTLAANVVTAAIREASLREQIAVTEELADVQARQLRIVERLEQLGTAALTDVVEKRGELADTRASLPALQLSLDQVRHRLAVYTGHAPGSDRLPQFRLSDIALPVELPLGVPSELARRRPDIRAAEALLQQAGAKVGIATANFYPRISLSAQGGSLAANGAALLSGSGAFYLLGASLAQPIFHGQELQARRRAAVAAYEQAAAAYEETVLLGFGNVADTLRALAADAARLQERAAASAHARGSYEIASRRYAAGGVSLLNLLDGERRVHAADILRIQAAADRYADSAALLQALGGGWWTDEGTATAPPRGP